MVNGSVVDMSRYDIPEIHLFCQRQASLKLLPSEKYLVGWGPEKLTLQEHQSDKEPNIVCQLFDDLMSYWKTK